jgi:hypothetical protein
MRLSTVKGERRAYISLIAISAILCGAVFLLSVRNSHNNGQKICAIISIIVSTPVIEPTNPNRSPNEERSYQNYLKFQKLDKAFSCN